ncbi:MAG: hypothetical protein V4507_05015, partial [Verrucomicrobiota bacterium]
MNKTQKDPFTAEGAEFSRGKTILFYMDIKSEGNDNFFPYFKNISFSSSVKLRFLCGEKMSFWFLLFLALAIPLCSETIPPKTTNPPAEQQFPVPPPKVIPDKKGLESQRQQSESFLKWIDPRRVTKSEQLKTHLPDFADQVHYFADDKTFTHVPRTSVLKVPSEGKALALFKSDKEIKSKTFIEPESIIREHQSLFEKVEATEGKAPP